MSSDNDSSSSPLSYSDMYNDDAFMEGDQMSRVGSKSPNVDYGFDDEDALDFGAATYNVPYMTSMQDQASVATSNGGGVQERVSSSSSVSSVPSDQGGRPSSLLGGGDDSSVVSASPSVDSYGFSAVGSVAGGSIAGGSIAGGSLSGGVIPPIQSRSTSNPTPYHNMAPSATGSISTNPYYSYDSQSEDDASVEMSLVTPEPSTPGRSNPFGKTRKSEAFLQDNVKIQFVPGTQKPPATVTKTARQTSTTKYPDHPDDEFGVSVVSSLQDDASVQSSAKGPYVPSPFAQVGNVPQGQMAPTSPLTPVFPDYHHHKTLPTNAPMAPLPQGQPRMMDPSIPRPDSSDSSDSESEANHHNSEYPSGEPVADGQQQYHDEFLEKNQKKLGRSAGPVSVSSSTATEKPKKQQARSNPFSKDANKDDPEAAINLKDHQPKKKKSSCCRKCLCIFIPILLLILGGGGYYAYTKDFFGFDFFGLYESKDVAQAGSEGASNPENPQDKPANDPQDNDGGTSFPSSPSPTATPFETEPPKGIIDNGGNDNANSTNGDNDGGDITNSTGDDTSGNNTSTNTNNPTSDPLIGVIGTKQPHLTPVDTKTPTQSPTIMLDDSQVLLPTATPTIMNGGATSAPTTKAESEIIVQYRTTIQSYLTTQGILFDTTESTMTVNALDRLMNDVVVAKFQEEESSDPFYEDIYRVTQRFVLYCLGVSLEEPAQEDYVKAFEIAQPWTPRSDPSPLYPLVFERLADGETKSSDHCNWFGVICSAGEIVSITWNQQGLDGTIPSEISLLRTLTSIDLGNNYIHGTVPGQLYEIPNLEKLVLKYNYLDGQLPSQVSSSRFTHLDMGHCLLSGNLQSLVNMQGLEYLDLGQNTLTGSIPEDLLLPNISYLNLGHNLLTGPLPTQLAKNAFELRHIHLEHNGFSGNLPIEYLWAGKFKLETLKVNNNQLTGAVPSGGSSSMLEFTLQNNQFSTPLAQETCDLDQTLGLGGSVIEFEADCSICQCMGGNFCSSCNA